MIKVERSGARVDVILSAPERRNAQTEETWIELARIGRDLDPRTRVVVLRAEGESFSAGLDKRVFTGEANPNLQKMLQGTNEEMQDRIAVFQEAFAGGKSAMPSRLHKSRVTRLVPDFS